MWCLYNRVEYRIRWLQNKNKLLCSPDMTKNMPVHPLHTEETPCVGFSGKHKTYSRTDNLISVQCTYFDRFRAPLLPMPVESVLPHNGRFCNGCITKERLHWAVQHKCFILWPRHNCSIMKNLFLSSCFCFVIFCANFVMKGKLFKTKSCKSSAETARY